MDISRHSRYLVETAKDIVKTIVDELHTSKYHSRFILS